MDDKKVKKRTGSNVEILDQINKKVGAKGMTEEVEEVHSGDAVICRRSMYDKKKRTYIGTDRQITSAINQSNGCKVIEKGAKAIEPDGKVVQYKTGGKLKKAKKFKKIDFTKMKKLRKEEKEKIRQKRWIKKRERVQELANNMQRLRLNVTKDLKDDSEKNEKNHLTALVIAIIDHTGERIGNDESATNGHFGVSGFRKKHIKIEGNKITLKYVGKSGVDHDTSFSDADIAKHLKKAIKNSPSKYVFTTKDGFKIKGDRVNRYLSEFNVSVKDMRGYKANKLILEKLKNVEPDEKESKRKRQLLKVVKSVSEKIGHGKATLRQHYMIPELEYEWVENSKLIDIKDLGYYNKGGELKAKSKTLKKYVTGGQIEKGQNGKPSSSSQEKVVKQKSRTLKKFKSN